MEAVWRRRSYVLGALISLGVVVTAVTAPGLLAQESTERILFETEDTGHLATINADGTEFRKVKTGHYSDQDPLWSPDRTKIAFYQGEGDSELWIANPDGSEAALVSPPEHQGDGEAQINGFDWSPDSTRIVYARTAGRDRVLVVHAVTSSKEVLLMEGETAGEFPAWSPDGAQIAFVSTLDRGNDLFTIAPEGGAATQLTRLPRWSRLTEPIWAPDGTRIAYERRGRATWETDIVVLDLATGDRMKIAATSHPEVDPRWAPDDDQLSYVLFTHFTDRYEAHLMLFDLAMGEDRDLFDGGMKGMFHAWSPDGTRIAMSVGGYTIGAHLWIVDVETGDATDLGEIANGRHLDW